MENGTWRKRTNKELIETFITINIEEVVKA